jgi:hypothetical protein
MKMMSNIAKFTVKVTAILIAFAASVLWVYPI